MHRFLALGDSYTIGEGVSALERWPSQLVARLRGQGVDIADPVMVAQTGWTSDALAAAMDAAPLVPPYALVTLLIGVNDQYHGWPVAGYRVRFAALLARAVALAGENAGRVVVLSIPDWGVTPFARAQARDAGEVGCAIDACNTIARGQAVQAGAAWVDVTGISRAPGRRDELTGDGLHPSAAQYTHWVDAVLPAARAALALRATSPVNRGRRSS